MLAAFPENYRLYEHVKKSERDGKTEVKSKKHAGGGNDRQDAYLYGHPEGKKKRFRSPADFFPHLLWLCTDESGDPDNCTCKICSPEDLENAIPGAKIKVERVIKPESVVRPSLNTAAAGMTRQPSAQSTKLKPDPGVPKPAKSPTTSKPSLVPTPLPKSKNPDQHIDSQYHTFTYRPGEVVWFQRGQAWGLGAVLRRWRTANNQFHYTVQPLSWPGHYSEAVTKSSDLEMRPWLAWSVPRFTNDALNHLRDPPMYETADWQGMMQKRYGNGDLEVDGSILAAKAIDSTYTPFHLNKVTEPEPGVTEKHYDAIYLGAEKIWTGDPIRLQIGSGTDIMVVHSIIETLRSPSSTTNTPHPPPQTCHFLGDLYTLSSTPHPNPSIPSPASPSNNPHLPPRMTQDLAHRNARSIPTKNTASFWHLVAPRQRLDLHAAKGRWYEATRILPVLQPASYAEAARTGSIQEASLWMNSRGDCLNSNRPAGSPKLEKFNRRRETRLEALGQAVPPHTEIMEGLAPPSSVMGNLDPALSGASAAGFGGERHAGQSELQMEIDPKFDSASDAEGAKQHAGAGGAGRQAGSGQGGLEDFMDLGEMDSAEGMQGFGRDYGGGGQRQGGGYY